MLPWKSKQLELWINPTQTTLYLQEDGRTNVLAEITRAHEEDLALHFSRCIQAFPIQRCKLQIVLDDSMVRFLRVEPPVNTPRFEDLEAAARIRFEALFDLPSSEWEIQGNWSALEAFWACAAPLNLLTALRACLNEPRHKRIHIAGCVPAFVHYWNQQQSNLARDVQSLGVVNETAITMALIRNEELVEIKTFPLPDLDVESLQAVERAVHSLSLQLDLKVPKVVWLASKIVRPWKTCETEQISWRRLSIQGAS